MLAYHYKRVPVCTNKSHAATILGFERKTQRGTPKLPQQQLAFSFASRASSMCQKISLLFEEGGKVAGDLYTHGDVSKTALLLSPREEVYGINKTHDTTYFLPLPRSLPTSSHENTMGGNSTSKLTPQF